MKHTIILIIGILATFLFAETGKHKITKVYGTGIAFNEHYIVTTGNVARHSEKLDSIVVMVNGLPIIARLEHSADTVLDRAKNEYMNMAIIQVDNKVLLNACKIEDRLVTTGEPVTVTGFLQEDSKLQIKSFPAKVVADSTFPEYVARALNVRTPGGFSGAAISSHGKVIGMSFGNSTRKSDISFFYDGMLLSEYIRNQNKHTTTDVSKCTYQVRSYVTVE
ncbi:trypsin-like peptidase domain-containing protein [Hallerella succinigenes]|uniref:Serine protease n=1 Tax=Hallerella succinigenes TaxID=1896222 RepID=A0A2M9A9K6_9BACT|nr:trypsin-like peptidase domain-containing protein [Hallerella succinigenes]PJJ42303.1 hypothetical protein BGX16_2328 [Hallerella succinigenes]